MDRTLLQMRGERAMRSVFRWLVAIGIVLQFLTPSAYAGWKNRSTINAEMATEYISQLKAGAQPGSINRPTLRHINNYKAKQQRKMFIQAMDEAEALARAGKRDQIREFEFTRGNLVEQSGSSPQRSKSTY